MNHGKWIGVLALAGMIGGSAVAEVSSENDGCYYDYYDTRRTLVCEDHVHSELVFESPSGAVQRSQRGLNRRVLNALGGGVLAGEGIDDLTLDVVGSYTDFDDSVGASGDSAAISLQLSGNHGDNIVGLALTQDAMDIDGGTGIDTTTIDGYYGFGLGEHLTVGGQGSYSWVEATGQGSEEQWSLGGFVAGSIDLGDRFSVGAVSAVSYFDGIGDSEWLWSSMVDLSADLCEKSGATVYVGHTDTLEASVLDGYLTIGGELNYRVSDQTNIAIGYEVSAEHDTSDDSTVFVQFTHAF